MKLFNLFPLTVLQDTIHIEDKERIKLVNEIKRMRNEETDEKNLTMLGQEIQKVMNFYLQIQHSKTYLRRYLK